MLTDTQLKQAKARHTPLYILAPDGSGRPADRFPGPWQIMAINPRRVKVIQNGRTLTADKTLVTDQDPGTAAPVIGMPYRAPWAEGTVVCWAEAPAKFTHGNRPLFVILKDDGGPAVTRLALLGGDSFRYIRRAPAAKLTEVTLGDLPSALT